VAIAAVLVASGFANAGTVILDRGLPTANLNNVAGSDRSNVAWGYGSGYPDDFTGDTFQVGTAGKQVRIDTIRVWFTVGGLGANNLADNLGSLTLHGGSMTSFNPISNTGLTGNAASNSNVVISQVTYAGGQNYEGYTGTDIKLWQADFNNLGWVVNGGETNVFGLQASILSGSGMFLHASNAAQSGSVQEGADGQYLWMYSSGLVRDSALQTSLGNGWDKVSDINVQIEGAVVPLPAAVWGGILLLSGMGAKRSMKILRK
jgi:hypothetical protein